MPAILLVSGGESYQLCTVTHSDIKDHKRVNQSFPINRKISEAG